MPSAPLCSCMVFTTGCNSDGIGARTPTRKRRPGMTPMVPRGPPSVWWNPRMLALGGTDTGIYKFLLLCHILVAIVGLGAVMLNGLYGAQAKSRQGAPGRAIAEANFAV